MHYIVIQLLQLQSFVQLVTSSNRCQLGASLDSCGGVPPRYSCVTKYRRRVAYVSGCFLSRTQITPNLATLLTNNIERYRTTRTAHLA
uniref:Putative secreted protein n=1 Tax=Ixodes ricinus TaxID=34613 RepID=A0A147BAE7_IXORI